MSTSVPVGAAFLRFPRLPAEIRHQIWRLAILRDKDPIVGVFRKGCWRVTPLSPSDSLYMESRPDWNYHLDLHCDLLDGMSAFLPTAFVNREARALTMDWFERISLDYDRPIFERHFDLRCDVVYIPYLRFEDFREDQTRWMYRADISGQSAQASCSVRNVAIAPEMLENAAQRFFNSLHAFTKLKTVLVIVDEPPSLKLPDLVASTRRWTYDDLHAGSFVWDSALARFQLVDGRNTEYYEDFERIEEALKDLKPPSTYYPQLPELEFRPVLVRQIM
ncbi:hypothetical protein ANO11243_076030 [Dothideomycetidae sp. 11243]|nr:hypothetical protein ANO11243_076030 [fungal sp. No.11243]